MFSLLIHGGYEGSDIADKTRVLIKQLKTVKESHEKSHSKQRLTFAGMLRKHIESESHVIPSIIIHRHISFRFFFILPLIGFLKKCFFLSNKRQL